ncbi:MAG: hypothetical protein IJL24_06860 [Treponema sp.]|nr:hypothetical protein [Treponema sp.]
MKKFFSVLFSIIFAVCLFATLLLAVVRANFSYSAITKIASEILKPVSKAPVNDDGLFHPGDAKCALVQYGGFDLSSVDLSSVDFANLDVNALVGQYLEAAGVDVEPEFVAEVLASPDFSDFVDKYAGEVVNYMTGATAELSIDPADVKKIMNKSIDMYEKHTGQVVDRSGLDKAIETNVASMKTEITAALDTAKEENAKALAALKIVDFILSMKFFLICVGVCAFIALVIFLINNERFRLVAICLYAGVHRRTFDFGHSVCRPKLFAARPFHGIKRSWSSGKPL